VLLVVAWDGASFELTDPLMARGELPNLEALVRRGQRLRLRSTWPPVTFPAWTSFMTAASPCRHGITDFCLRDGYELRFANASHRRLPTIWSQMNAAGLRTGVYGLPATYPPESLDGIQVPGFDTPLGAGAGRRLTHPPELAQRLRGRYGRLAIEGVAQSQIGPGWHEMALTRMLDDVDLRTRIVSDLFGEQRFDVFLVHFAESDTVSHQFWQFCDPESPRHVNRPPLADAIARVYRALDAALGRLVEAAGEDTTVMVVSDHGSGGAGDRAVFWNRWLSDHHWLRFAAGSTGLARGLKRAALRFLPAAAQPTLFRAFPRAGARLEARARLGGIDWSRTLAFSEELPYYPSIWLNLRGREPRGVVEPGDAECVLRDIGSALLEAEDPTEPDGRGGPIVERIYRREELFDGPFAERAPDLILQLRERGGYSYAGASSRGGGEREAVRRLRPEEMSGSRGTSMAGSHRLDGLCVVAGAGILASTGAGAAVPDSATLADAGATLLGLAGLGVPEEADGCSWMNATTVRPPVVAAPGTGLPRTEEYDEEAEREIADKLRALGYMD
jgi:predicted AlkP superfamily phosphohydrolase/phosphomutase